VELESSRDLADAHQPAAQTRRPVIEEWPVDSAAAERCSSRLIAACVIPRARRHFNRQPSTVPAMPLNSIDVLGFVAGALTTAAFIPQVLKSWQTRDLSGISLRMYSLFTAGVALWLLYGIALANWPIVLWNLVTLVLAGGVLILKLKHK
jgi:MtN3 and saliva related transmembrane protein